MTFADIDILSIGNTIQISGVVFTGEGKVITVPLPGEDCLTGSHRYWSMTEEEFERVLNQSDVLDIRSPHKAILRKSQRLIDQIIAWKVYERDDFRCRYCGDRRPLTVDHVILWEAGGATIEANLISACRRCNKTRGSMEYVEWLNSPEYFGLSRGLTELQRFRNAEVVQQLDKLKAIKAKPRSR